MFAGNECLELGVAEVQTRPCGKARVAASAADQASMARRTNASLNLGEFMDICTQGVVERCAMLATAPRPNWASAHTSRSAGASRRTPGREPRCHRRTEGDGGRVFTFAACRGPIGNAVAAGPARPGGSGVAKLSRQRATNALRSSGTRWAGRSSAGPPAGAGRVFASCGAGMAAGRRSRTRPQCGFRNRRNARPGARHRPVGRIAGPPWPHLPACQPPALDFSGRPSWRLHERNVRGRQ